MDQTLSAAVVAAFGAIIVAVISAIVAISANRRNTEAQIELESYKDTLTQYRQKDAFSNELARKNADILGQACSSVQRAKDHIRDLWVQDDPLATVEEIAQICDEIVELHATSHYMLPEIERNALHNVKNIAKRTVNTCNKALGGKPELVQDLAGFFDPFNSAHKTLISKYEKWQNIAVHGKEN